MTSELFQTEQPASPASLCHTLQRLQRVFSLPLNSGKGTRAQSALPECFSLTCPHGPCKPIKSRLELRISAHRLMPILTLANRADPSKLPI